MARTVRDANLETRAARSRLKARGKPHYRVIEEGLHLGYRKPRGRRGKPAGAGKWVARHYVGGQAYTVEMIGVADDFSDADGFAVLDYRQAQAKARERMVRRVHAANGVTTGPLTVKAAVEAYLEFLESNRKSAHDSRLRAAAFIYPALGDVEVATLTTDILRKWHVALAKTPARLRTKPGAKQQHREVAADDEAVRRRRSSANRVLTILKAALNHAFAEDKTNTLSDAAWRKVKPFEDVDAARLRYLQIEEARRLINAAEPAFRRLVRAALATGARYGELAALNVEDFNCDSDTLHVRTSKSGKGRHIVLADEGVELFVELAAVRPSHAPMLTKSDGMRWLSSHQGRPMAEACRNGRIEPAANFHALRHTYASHAIMNGVPLLVVAKNLGHADTRMVEKHYGHLAPSYVADAIRAGAPRFGFKPDNNVVELSGRK